MPARRRRLARWFHTTFGASIVHARRLAGFRRTAWYRASRAVDQTALRLRIRELVIHAPTVRGASDLRAPPTGGVARQSQAGAPALSAGRAAGADAGEVAEAHGAASRVSAGAHRARRAVEHGLRARCADRRPGVSGAHRRRSVESRESITGRRFFPHGVACRRGV